MTDENKNIAIEPDQKTELPIKNAIVGNGFLYRLQKFFIFSTNLRHVVLFWLFAVILIFSALWLGRRTELIQDIVYKLTSSVHAIQASREKITVNDIKYEPEDKGKAGFPKAYTFSKMVTNLRKAELGDSSSPMIALVLIVESQNQDAIDEVKQKEAHLKDQILRIAEGFTYSELASKEGKILFSEHIKAMINLNLVNTSIDRVLYKNFIIKP